MQIRWGVLILCNICKNHPKFVNCFGKVSYFEENVPKFGEFLATAIRSAAFFYIYVTSFLLLFLLLLQVAPGEFWPSSGLRERGGREEKESKEEVTPQGPQKGAGGREREGGGGGL